MPNPANRDPVSVPLAAESVPATPPRESRAWEEETDRSLRRENRQVLILVLAVGLFMVLAHGTPLRAWITNTQAWKGYVRELGWLAHVAFTVVCALAVGVGVPRLPLTAAAGLIFGFAEGLALSLLGSILGSYGAFVMARFGFRRAALARAARWPWLATMLERPSWLRVFWVRQLMLPGLVLNVMLGVTRVRHRTFLAGTALGYLPLATAFALVGSGLGKGSLAQTLVQLFGALAVVNLLGWLIWHLVRRGHRE